MKRAISESVRAAIEDAIGQGQTPGAVCFIGRGDDTICHEAVGHRSLVPRRLPMLPDTVFDLASLTKVVATTTLVMQLAERGVLSIDDEVRSWLPSFSGDSRSRVTIRHLLTHSSGLPAHVNYMDRLGEEVPRSERWRQVVDEICRLPSEYTPGESAIYSCLGFILLAAIVEKAAKECPTVLTRERIFAPVGMSDTGFCPPPKLFARCASTEQLPGGPLRGVVHDENARYLGGFGGNAGLFSTAQDLARFARTLLAGGEHDGARILNAESVEALFTEEPIRGGLRRCLGWRMARADDPCMHGAPTSHSIGHTGYTGTSLWLDRHTGLLVILLTNRVHLGRDVEVEPLRRQIGRIAMELTEAYHA